MSKSFSVPRLRMRRIIALTLALATALAIAVPAIAATRPSGPPRQYSATFVVTEGLGDTLDFLFTITNESQGAAVLGSANITVPLTNIGGLSIEDVSNDKTWSATLPAGSNVIRLRAIGDNMKLQPGESITISFNAESPEPDETNAQTLVFATAAKASRDFKGSSTFTLVGANPVVVVCPDEGTCTANLGNSNNATPDHQSGSVTLQDDCFGCILTVTETPGNFCSEGDFYLSENGSDPITCHSPFVLRFNFIPSYSGEVTVVLTCDVTDCPEIIEPDPCETECSFFTISSETEDYPVWFSDDDDAPFGQPITEFCDPESYIFPPCLLSDGRLESNGDLQATLLLSFSGGIDPRTAR